MIGVLILRVDKRAAQGVGAEEDVGVGEEEEVGAVIRDSLPRGEGHGMGFAEPAWRQGVDGEGDQVRIFQAVHDPAGRVGGAVINGDHAQVGVILGEERLETGADVVRLVARGHDDRNGWVAGRLAVEGLVQQIGDLRQPVMRLGNTHEPGQGDQPDDGSHDAMDDQAGVCACECPAKRAPTKKMMAPAIRAINVEPRPTDRLLRSLTAPIRVGAGASPIRWIISTCPASAVARMVAGTALTVAALTGPEPRKMRNSAAPSAGSVNAWVWNRLGPKNRTIAGKKARAALHAGDEVECAAFGSLPALRDDATDDRAQQPGDDSDGSHQEAGFFLRTAVHAHQERGHPVRQAADGERNHGVAADRAQIRGVAYE